MRKTLLVLLLAMAVIWMFKHPDDLKRYSSSALRSASQYLASLADDAPAAPSKAGSQDQADGGAPPGSPPPPAPPLPEDVYYLLQPVRFTSASGSTLHPAGTPVRRTGGGNGKLMVTDESGNAVVEPSVLTRDPEVIARLAHRTAEDFAARTSSENSKITQQIQEIDAKLVSLKSELNAILERDALARKQGRKVVFATSEAFVRSNITMLEKRRAELLALRPVVTPPVPPIGGAGPQ